MNSYRIPVIMRLLLSVREVEMDTELVMQQFVADPCYKETYQGLKFSKHFEI